MEHVDDATWICGPVLASALAPADGSSPGGFRGWAGSTERRGPRWGYIPSPVCTTKQESGTEPADML